MRSCFLLNHYDIDCRYGMLINARQTIIAVWVVLSVAAIGGCAPMSDGENKLASSSSPLAQFEAIDFAGRSWRVHELGDLLEGAVVLDSSRGEYEYYVRVSDDTLDIDIELYFFYNKGRWTETGTSCSPGTLMVILKCRIREFYGTPLLRLQRRQQQ